MRLAHGSPALWLSFALPVAAVLLGSCGDSRGPFGLLGWRLPDVTAVSVSPGTTVARVGETVALTASVTDAAGRQLKRPEIRWSSSDTTIARVSATGEVTILAPGGPVTITAASGGRSGSGRLVATNLQRATTSGVTYVRAAATSGSGTSVSLLLSSTTGAGDLVVVGFDFPSVSFASIGDNQGNTFAQVGSEISTPGGAKTRLYYARNIKGGSETVTVTMSGSASYIEIYALEYAGADTANPLEASAQGKGSSGSVTSGTATTTTANDLVLGFCIGDNSCTAGSGFTARSTFHSNLVEDRIAATAGSYAATGSSSGGWAMIMAAFKPQSAGPPVASVTVAPATGTVQAGSTLPLTATTLDAGGNVLTGRTVTWTSSGTTLATVSATGVVTGVAPGGPVTITATSEGQSGTAAITVTPVPVASVTVAPATADVSLGQTVALAATTKDAGGNVLTGRAVAWSTGDATLATVSGTGVVTGVALGGPVTITATSEGQSGTAAVTVVPAPVPVAAVTVAPDAASVYVGQTVALSATTTDADGNVLTGRTIAWTSSTTALATVSASGVVTGVAAGGPVTVTATSEGQSGTAAVTVALAPVATVTVSPAAATVAVTRTVPLGAVVKDAGGNVLTGRTVTWTTSDPTLATVSAAGVVTGVAAGGPVTITADCEGQTGTASITVTPVAVATVTVAPATASVMLGQTVALTATPRDAAGNVLTGQTITWSAANPAIATVSATGVVTGVAVGGPVTISASAGGKTGTASVTVTQVQVASVTVTPNPASVAVGQTLQLTATPKNAAGSVLVGLTITWTSSNTARARVNASGVVTGVATGSVTIRAATGGRTGSSSVTVVRAPVATVTVAPAAPSVAVGLTVALTATTKDANGTVLTGRTVTWSSGNTALAAVSGTGIVTGVAVGGPVTITATSEGQSGTAAVTVTPAPPTVTLAANPGFVTPGGSSTLTWSSASATECTASGGWSGPQATAGSLPVSPAATTTYTLACTGDGGTTTRSATVYVGATPPGVYVYPLGSGPTGRYLVDQFGQPYLLVGDAAWSLIAQLTDQAADTYLADRQQRGFNAVLTNLVEHALSDSAPADIYGIRPFTGKAFATPNEAYFAHVDHIIQSAAADGIVVLLAPAYLGGCSNQGWCTEINAATDAEMTGWGQYLGRRYGGYPNIVWVIGGDTDPSASIKPKLVDVVNGIRQYDTQHLFTAHNQRTEMGVTPWVGSGWLNVNTTYSNGHEYTYAQTAYGVSPALPFFLVEAYYENENGSSAQSLRAESYWTVLSGGFGHVFGNCPLWGFGTTKSAGFCSGRNWQAQLGAQGSLSMTHFAKLFTARHWYSLVPDLGHTTLTAGYGTSGSSSYVTAACTADGSSIVAYLPSSRAVTVNGSCLQDATMTGWWVNPATGSATPIGTVSSRTAQTFTPPGGGDWVLVIDSPSFGFATPGG